MHVDVWDLGHVLRWAVVSNAAHYSNVVNVRVCACLVTSVVSDSLQPQGL